MLSKNREVYLASGLHPILSAASAVMRTTADAPSDSVEAFPAVMVPPSFWKTVASLPNFSKLTFLYSSSSDTIVGGLPRFNTTETSKSSSWNSNWTFYDLKFLTPFATQFRYYKYWNLNINEPQNSKIITNNLGTNTKYRVLLEWQKIISLWFEKDSYNFLYWFVDT